MSIGALKDRMISMKKDIEESDSINRELQTAIEAHTQRADDAEEQIKEMNSKVSMLEDKKCDMEDEIKEYKLKTETIITESDENSRFVRVLESRGNTNDGRLTELQTQLTQQTAEIERLDKLNRELQRRANDTEERLEEAEEKGIHLKSELAENQEELTQLRNNYQSMRASNQKMAEEEEKNERMLKQWQEEQEDYECRAEKANKIIEAMTKQTEMLEAELDLEKEKIASAETELDHTLAEISQM